MLFRVRRIKLIQCHMLMADIHPSGVRSAFEESIVARAQGEASERASQVRTDFEGFVGLG